MWHRRDFLKTSLIVAAGWRTSAHAAPGDAIAWLKELQQPPAKLPSDPPLAPLLRTPDGQPITTLDAWNQQRAVIQARWRKFLGTMQAKRTAVPKLTVLAEDQIEGVLRQRVSYEVEPGLTNEAYLLRPAAKSSTKRAGVVVFHSTVNHSIDQPAGIQGEPAKAFGLQLAKQGMVTFCPRNYLWPTNDRIDAKGEAAKFHQREPNCQGMAKMLYDSQVALDILAAQPDVDAERLGAVGHSLGAKEALYLAAFDERVRAAVSSEGGIGIKLSNWHDAWYLGADVQAKGFPLEHHELLALVAPRAFLLIGGDSADGDRSWPFIAAALPVYQLSGQEAAQRVGFWNHHQGHSVPDEAVRRIGQWCERYLET
ncbi:MAG TPA: dienelactone hydrolase family protein [Pirellulaceae bacterium]|nr:dienelactone hydrolase family protein [Pirellulaceae bacterium]